MGQIVDGVLVMRKIPLAKTAAPLASQHLATATLVVGINDNVNPANKLLKWYRTAELLNQQQ